MAGTRVLVVEDDPPIRELVEYHLGVRGFSVIAVPDAETAWLHVNDADLIVLDRMLPGIDGLEFLRRLRESGTENIPVLVLTALGTENDRVVGLEEGADDYLVKPFSIAELVARVRALLRRTGGKRVEVAGLQVDTENRMVYREGVEVSLTRREFDLLQAFLENPGRVFDRDELLDRVWGSDFMGGDRTVDQHVAQLRAALGADLIRTVRGRGYQMGK